MPILGDPAESSDSNIAVVTPRRVERLPNGDGGDADPAGRIEGEAEDRATLPHVDDAPGGAARPCRDYNPSYVTKLGANEVTGGRARVKPPCARR